MEITELSDMEMTSGQIRSNHEVMILRIEARTSADDYSSYHDSNQRLHIPLKDLLAQINQEIDDLDRLAVVQSAILPPPRTPSSSGATQRLPPASAAVAAATRHTLPGSDDEDNEFPIPAVRPQLIKHRMTHEASVSRIHMSSASSASSVHSPMKRGSGVAAPRRDDTVMMLNAVNALRQRDLRRLDFKFNPVDEPTILVRRHAILVRAQSNFLAISFKQYHVQSCATHTLCSILLLDTPTCAWVVDIAGRCPCNRHVEQNVFDLTGWSRLDPGWP
jgi:hypothetical protein